MPPGIKCPLLWIRLTCAPSPNPSLATPLIWYFTYLPIFLYHCFCRRRRCSTSSRSFHSKSGKSATEIECFSKIEKPTSNKTFLELHHWKTWYGILLIYPSFYITTSTAAAVAHIHIACSRPLLHQSWSWCFHAKGGKWPWSHLKARTSRLYF